MMNRNTRFAPVFAALLLGATLNGQADLKEAVEAAQASDIRTEAERERDANRKPLETLTFFGLEQDMDVLELVPGGGWYTKILAPVLAEDGSLTLAIGTQRAAPLVEEHGWDVEILETGSFERAEGARRFDLSEVDFGRNEFDMVLTFRNLHNLTEAGRKAMNEAAFKALKRGGVYGVVDHTRRHMQADSSENWRRMDPVLMIREIEAVGFEFEDFSNLHYRLDDELRFEVGRRSVTGNTDRFTLKFVKP